MWVEYVYWCQSSLLHIFLGASLGQVFFWLDADLLQLSICIMISEHMFSSWHCRRAAQPRWVAREFCLHHRVSPPSPTSEPAIDSALPRSPFSLSFFQFISFTYSRFVAFLVHLRFYRKVSIIVLVIGWPSTEQPREQFPEYAHGIYLSDKSQERGKMMSANLHTVSDTVPWCSWIVEANGCRCC